MNEKTSLDDVKLQWRENMLKNHIKIDGKLKTKMTKDWLLEFPEYKKTYPCTIKKRVGPLVISVWYHTLTGSTKVRAKASYFNLANYLDTTCADLNIEFPSYTYPEHEKGKYKLAAEFLRENAPIPLEGPLTFTQIINGYRAPRTNPALHRYSEREYADPAIIAAWCGREDLAQEYLEEFFEDHQKNGTHALGRWKREDWYQHMKELLKNPDALRDVTNAQLEKFKFQKLPYQDIIMDI